MIDWSFEQVACEATKANYAMLHSKTRLHEVVLARFLCYMHLRKTTTWSLSKIGERYGKDHASVNYGLGKCQDWLDIKDTEFTEMYQYFKDNINTETIKYDINLNADQVRAIQLLYDEGVTYHRIAGYYGISKEDVKEITSHLLPRNKNLSNALRVAIIDSYLKTNLTEKDIMEKHGVGYVAVRGVVKHYKKYTGQTKMSRSKIKEIKNDNQKR